MSEFFTESEDMFKRAIGESPTNAGFWDYIALLGLTKEELAHKRVLDIGSGQENRFTNDARQHTEEVVAISVNPQLAFSEVCQEWDISVTAHQGSVAALAQGKLPFRDNSFDTIVSVMGTPKYLLDSEVGDFLDEVWRVLKPGGVAKFWPFSFIKTPEFENVSIDADQRFVSFESVEEEILSRLHESFHHAANRLVIRKPPETGEALPAQIGYYAAKGSESR